MKYVYPTNEQTIRRLERQGKHDELREQLRLQIVDWYAQVQRGTLSATQFLKMEKQAKKQLRTTIKQDRLAAGLTPYGKTV